MPRSVLEAIKMGIWDYEPKSFDDDEYDPTSAMPGTDDKVAILSQRLQSGLPLWHAEDRRGYDDPEP